MLSLQVQTAEGSELVEIVDPFFVLCGFTGRDDEVVAAHVRELAGIGVAPPTSVPLFLPMPNHLLLRAGERVEVVSAETSGEAEPVIIRTLDGRELLTVGSDHTDRGLEATSIAAGKVACPKLISMDAWEFAEVADRWDELLLRSASDGAEPHQQTCLAALKPAAEILDALLGAVGVPDERPLVVFLGTLPASAPEPRPAGSFVARLEDPLSGRTLQCAYAFADLSTCVREVAA